MGLSEFFSLLTGVLQFPTEVKELIKILKATPQEKHESIMGRIKDEGKKFSETGRPTWN